MLKSILSLAVITGLALTYTTYSASIEENLNNQTASGTNSLPTIPQHLATESISGTSAKLNTAFSSESTAQNQATNKPSKYNHEQARKFFASLQSAKLNRGENIFATGNDKRTVYAVTAEDARNVLLKGGSEYLNVKPGDDLTLKTAKRDQLGNVIYKYSQTFKNIPVFGQEIVVQINNIDEVTLIGGQYEPNIDINTTPGLSSNDAINNALLHFDDLPTNTPEYLSEPTLMIYTDGSNEPVLTYVTDVEYLANSGYKKEKIFVDANTGLLVNSFTLMQSSFNYSVHSMNNQCLSQNSSGLPGTEITKEDGEHAAGVDANSAHAYHFYQHMFGRDSWDDNGRKTISTIHARFQGSNGTCHSDNAFFTGDQLVFGDGDTGLNNPGAAIDIFTHEFTHGFTSVESNLTYQNESGAINEAMSDIMGAGVSLWKTSGGTSSGNPENFTSVDTDWDMGETSALTESWQRHLDDPAEDGQSKDNYPDRNTGSSDNGGVHTNSGIMNLAFYMLSEGGTHPRDKSTTDVTAVGEEKALQIYYYANNNLFTSSTNFSDARQKVAAAAKTLYSCEEWESVHQSFDAINVPGSRGDECDTSDGDGAGGNTGGDTGNNTGDDSSNDTTTPASDENIAVSSAYRSSSSYNSWYYPVQNSTDDNSNSYWVSRNIYSPASEEYVMMDLGSNKTFSSINVSWGGSDAAGAITMWAWQNGRWTKIASKNGSPATGLEFDSQQARYVMLTMSNGYYRRWYAISEITIQ